MVEKKRKWDWKIFWIVILVIYAVYISTAYSSYQQEAQQVLNNYSSNYDCYPRGTIQDYFNSLFIFH